MESAIYLREKDVEKIKAIFGLERFFSVVPLPTAKEGIVTLEVPGVTITPDRISEAAHRGFVFSGHVKSYDDERLFVSNGREYSIVRAHALQPIASVNRKGEVVPEEREEVIRFWRLIDEVNSL